MTTEFSCLSKFSQPRTKKGSITFKTRHGYSKYSSPLIGAEVHWRPVRSLSCHWQVPDTVTVLPDNFLLNFEMNLKPWPGLSLHTTSFFCLKCSLPHCSLPLPLKLQVTPCWVLCRASHTGASHSLSCPSMHAPCCLQGAQVPAACHTASRLQG